MLGWSPAILGPRLTHSRARALSLSLLHTDTHKHPRARAHTHTKTLSQTPQTHTHTSSPVMAIDWGFARVRASLGVRQVLRREKINKTKCVEINCVR